MDRINKSELYLSNQLGYAHQKRRGFTPRKDNKPWPLTLPLDWNADPFNDRNWQFQLHAWRMTDPILVEYFKTGDTMYLAEALVFIEDWHSYHFQYKNSTIFSWYDMATGIRAMRLAFFLELVQADELEVSERTLEQLLEMADEHARRLQNKDLISPSNHGLFQVFGLNLLCSVNPTRPACKGGRTFASRMLQDIMITQFTPQGMHREHSPSYHYFAVNILECFRVVERFDNPEIGALVSKARALQPWLAHPDGTISSIGDSVGTWRGAPIDPTSTTCLGQSAPDMRDANYYAVGDFSDSGYVIIRSLPDATEQSMLFFTGMWHASGIGHKHADDLSFELFDQGRFIFIDSGKYGYNDDIMRRYMISSAAHNTVSLKDKPFSPKDTKPYGSCLKSPRIENGYFVLQGTVTRKGLFDHTRVLRYRPGEILRVEDTIRSNKQRAFSSNLHLAPDLEVRKNDTGFEVEIGDRLLHLVFEGENCSTDSFRGHTQPHFGWVSTGYLQAAPTTTVRGLCQGKKLTMIWSLYLDGQTPPKRQSLLLKKSIR